MVPITLGTLPNFVLPVATWFQALANYSVMTGILQKTTVCFMMFLSSQALILKDLGMQRQYVILIEMVGKTFTSRMILSPIIFCTSTIMMALSLIAAKNILNTLH